MASVLFVAMSLCIAAAATNCQTYDASQGKGILILVLYSSLSDFDKKLTASLNGSVALLNGNLKLEFYDLGTSGCADQTIPALSVLIKENIFHESWSKVAVGIVGPSCTDSAYAVAKLIQRSHTHVGHLHTSPLPAPLADKVHSTSRGLLSPADLLADTCVALIKYANWSRVLALYQDTLTDMNYIFLEFQRQLEDMDRHNNNNNNNKSSISSNPKNSKLLCTPLIQNIPFHLNRILTVHPIRIIFLMLDAELARKVLCQAFLLKVYYPAYQWVIVNSKLNDILSVEKVDMGKYACDKMDIRRVLQNALFVSFQLENGFLSSHMNNQDENPESFFLYESTIQEMSEVLNSTESYDSASHLANDGATGFDYESLPTFPGEVSVEQIQNNIPVQVFLHSTLNSSFRNVSENISLISSELKIHIGVVNLPIAILFFCLNIIIIVVTVILQVITFIFRREQSVKSSSPALLHICYVGIYMLCLMTDVYFLMKSFVITSDNVYINLCRISLCMFGIGLTLVFGTLTMKSWRLYKIFVHFMDPGKYLSDITLLFFVCCLTIVDIVIYVIWFVFDPLRREYEEVSRNNLEGVIMNRSVCNSKLYTLFFMLLLGYQASIIAAMVWLTCNLRKKIPRMYTNLRTTNSELKLVYILLFLLCLGVPGYWVAHSLLHNLLFEFTLMGVLLYSMQTSFLLLLLLPPVLPVLKLSWKRYRYRAAKDVV